MRWLVLFALLTLPALGGDAGAEKRVDALLSRWKQTDEEGRKAILEEAKKLGEPELQVFLERLTGTPMKGERVAADPEPPATKPAARAVKGGPDWPQFYGGPTHNNFRAHKNAIRSPRVLWHVKDAYGQPTIRGGKLYAGGAGLFCIDPEQGKVIHQYRDDKMSFCEAPALTDELVIVRRRDGEVWALSPDLERIIWKYAPFGERGFAVPGVLASDRYIFASGGKVIALDTGTGNAAWIHETGADGKVQMVPAVANDLVFFGTWNGVFLALDLRTGAKRWRHEGEGHFGWTNPVAAYGDIFVGDRGIRGVRRGSIHCFEQATGKKKWSQEFGATGLSTPGIMPGAILVGYGRSVAAYDAQTGRRSRRPRIRCGPNAFGSPTLVGDTIYYGNLDGHLYAHDLESSQLKWAFRIRDGQALNVTYWQGRIFLSTTKGLYALGNAPGDPAPAGFILEPRQ
ncbi:MAG: PQQ-binding-like beta-propeller repeat protein [Planctomycetota bacterium]|nr:PQQ-binding-like beta-propeller repeat protein [Planctomycetota bacterium]